MADDGVCRRNYYGKLLIFEAMKVVTSAKMILNHYLIALISKV